MSVNPPFCIAKLSGRHSKDNEGHREVLAEGLGRWLQQESVYHKHQDLSLNPRTHVKIQVRWRPFVTTALRKLVLSDQPA